ncbi:hypothetical protein A0J61_03831 [Choanephora cucurbitarum]|uniref:F-box domain-containing protein n=1 Tax=Choanephora cucurbitarum TaxID=101091 RepID=A0A1C7NGF0_9FUNG|nr:hypothetical protein A0J61_03831 [Choanephora cucurbitarum]
MSIQRTPLEEKSVNSKSNQISPPPKLDNHALEKMQRLKPYGWSPLRSKKNNKKPDNIEEKSSQSPPESSKDIPSPTPSPTTSCNISPKTKKRTLVRLGSRKNENAKGDQQNGFADEYDVPISRLSVDCLLAIFAYCECFENYCTLLQVCSTWRAIASQPIIWRKVHTNWSALNRQIKALHSPRRRFDQLHYIRSLSILNDKQEMPLFATDIRIPPFDQLKELQLTSMYLADIDRLISWLDCLTTLVCQKTLVGQRPTLRLSMFSRLRQLEHLAIDFYVPCCLGFNRATAFLNSDRNLLSERLPESLKTFSLHGVYDSEELLFDVQLRDLFHDVPVLPDRRRTRQAEAMRIITQHQDEIANQDDMIANWIEMERTMVLKYNVLSCLTQLTSLSLGSVRSFTSRVWRECMIPCAGNLNYLSLAAWNGKRENPQLTVQRLLQPDLKDDAEEALAEFTSALKNIKLIELDRFVCSQGLINGLKQIQRPLSITHKLDATPKTTMDHLINSTLHQCKITWAQ